MLKVHYLYKTVNYSLPQETKDHINFLEKSYFICNLFNIIRTHLVKKINFKIYENGSNCYLPVIFCSFVTLNIKLPSFKDLSSFNI